MRTKSKAFVCLVALMFSGLVPVSGSAAEILPDFQFLNLGINNNATSSKMLIRLKISGGNSSKATSCSSYLLQEGSRITIGLTESSQLPNSFFWSGNSGNSAKTVSLDATSLICEFYTTPAYSLKTDTNKWIVDVVLLYGGKPAASQRVTLWNPISAPPSISVTSPTRGSKVSGEIKLDFASDGKEIWMNRETFVYVVDGWEAACRGGGGSRAIVNSVGQSATSTLLQNNSTSSQVWPIVRIDASRTADGSVSVYIQNSGKYMVCIGQSFGSKYDPNPPDPNTSEIQFANAGVAIDYVALPRTVTLDIGDSRLKRLENSIDEYITSKLACPKKVKTGSKSITCTLTSSISAFSDYDIQKLGYAPGTKVAVSAGQLEYVICVKAENWGSVACENDSDLIPAYYAHIKSVYLELGQSVKFSVPNYLSKTGYTSVECGGPGCEEFGDEYEVKGYKSPDVRRATAVPTASEQKRIVGVIKKGMNERCQKLPSNFMSLQGQYVKRVTSQNGLYGYVFKLGSKISIQIYEAGSVYWTFGPSPTKADNKTWESWGCGRTGIQTYG